MLGDVIRRLLGLADGEEVSELEERLSHLEDGVKRQEDRVADLRSTVEATRQQIDSSQDKLDSHEEAISHLIDVLSHYTSEEKLDELFDRHETLEEQIEALQKQLEALRDEEDTHNVVADAVSPPSQRPSGRVEATDGRSTTAVETASNLEEGENLWEGTTEAQKNILKVMYDLGYPVSYKELADELGRSRSTVKNHINNMKSSGFDFKEDVGYNNAKKYMLDERVKAFLTLRLND